jgi:hypothetical protein
MKICTRCKVEKDHAHFYKQKVNSKDGYQSHCKACDNARKAKWKVNNPDKAKKHEKQAEINRLHNKKRRQYRKELKQLPHIKANRNASCAKRRSAKINRVPKWATKQDILVIKSLYATAQILTKITGEKWHVDHAIPLQGVLVSGLHTPNNMQLMRGIENETKRNEYTVS